MKPRISLLATMCVFALASAGASAHDPKPGVTGDGHHATMNHADCGGWPYANFVQVDTNRDGFVDRTEVVSGSPWYPYYTPMDANRDGRVSQVEADAYTGAWRPDRWPYGTFVQVDSNGDGFVDRTEVVDSSPWYPYFSPMDANRDGRVTLAESDAYTNAWRYDAWPYGSFVTVDTNGDGFADRTEIVDNSPWSPYFGPMDANRDGRITQAESDAYTGTWRPGPWPGWTFVSVDANRDGFIDRTEVVATSPLHGDFDTIDSNDDSRATQEEIETFWLTMKHSGNPGHCMGGSHAPGMSGRDENSDEVHDKGPAPSFRTGDQNGDGFLSREELSPGSMLLGHFTAADTNNDGRLSSGEVDAHNAAMAEMGKKQ